MLTKAKLELYDKYYQRFEFYSLALSEEQRNLIESVFEKEDWQLIPELLYEVFLVNKGLASASLETEIRAKVKRQCDCEDTENYLISLSKKTNG